MDTHELRIKVVGDGGPSLAHPLAETGWNGDVRTYAIAGIPGDVPDQEVIRKFDQTINLTWLAGSSRARRSTRYEDRGRYRFGFEELGSGRIIRS